jgi:hypothetical protein
MYELAACEPNSSRSIVQMPPFVAKTRRAMRKSSRS